jgi:hypothetical protein
MPAGTGIEKLDGMGGLGSELASLSRRNAEKLDLSG